MDITKYRQQLESEKKRLEGELAELSQTEESEVAFRDEIADRLEEQGEEAAGTDELKEELHQVKTALAKIEDETYGYCVICKQPIESERLDANPAATTCITHRDA
ncbi:MAG: TraR/DksA C4-type zinc finger protein [Candidatus Vogelbacteria bacterium]|nr:TraR/DksA C4-type zinc finger protein [Candidatus Vogelbacteria bacterium]